MARLHHRPGRERRVFLASAATEHNRLARRKAIGLAAHLADRAYEAIRPPERFEVALAGYVVGENPLEFGQAPRKGRRHPQNVRSSRGLSSNRRSMVKWGVGYSPISNPSSAS